jgi:hypothetical protein
MKRKIAILLAATMVFGGSVSAMADQVETPKASTELTGDTVAGDGSVTAVATTVYSVLVSTNTKLDYSADPQGLASMGEATAQLGDLEGGNVYAKSKITVANKSSKDIVVNFAVTATEGTGSDTYAEMTDDVSDLAGTTDPKVALGVVASEATLADAGEGETADSALGYVATVSKTSDTGYALTSGNAVNVPVRLKAANYQISKSGDTYSYDIIDGVDNLGGAVQVAIAGKCSTEGWTDGTNSAVLPTTSVTYSFRDVATQEDEDNDRTGNVHKDSDSYSDGSKIIVDSDGQLASGKTITGIVVDPTVSKKPSVEDASAEKGEDAVLTVDLGEGKSKATAITGVSVTAPATDENEDPVAEELNESKYTFEDSELTIDKSVFTTVGEYTVKVEVDNNDTYTATVTVAQTKPVVTAGTSGSVIVTAPEGATFDKAFEIYYSGEYTDITSWKTGPTLSSDKTAWTITSKVLSYATPNDDGTYTFKVTITGDDDVTEVTYDPTKTA